jgi:hypothetical protein
MVGHSLLLPSIGQKMTFGNQNFCDPNEWNSEREMRLDMVIEYLTEGNDPNFFGSWECYDEDEFIEKYNKFIS